MQTITIMDDMLFYFIFAHDLASALFFCFDIILPLPFCSVSVHVYSITDAFQLERRKESL